MATNTPTLTRAERILEIWRTEPEFESARRYLDMADIGNASSEALGWLIDHEDARPSEEQWVDESITAVQAAGSEAAVRAMAEKVAELIEQAPVGLIDGPKPYGRELRGLER